MPHSSTYRGRFAPSPTGPLHFGSLIAAVGSYLDAKHHRGTWLVRMEDLDTPRCVPGATEDILRTLEAFGLHSDEPVIYQSRRTAAYEAALLKLQTNGAVYPCCCTRKEIADSALHGIEGPVYPGTCRDGIPAGREGRAWRVRTDNKTIEFGDALQGRITQHLETEIGDFVVKRADDLFAYQLAVVVDDAFQGITHIVRGADLLASTARQIHLQRLLNFPTPAYMHLPVAVNEAGEKLSKQTLAAPVDAAHPARTLMHVLDFLQQRPPAELANYDTKAVLDWAVANWDAAKMRGIRTLPAS
ncbi:MAG: tRNA glutamyl-Q(34) synthetase GluQRS [Sideroxyarcus sp.]|nr:tRNA glutamyl-Q(34) synthetase GluQRS [Sideroxyarcus sp.]